MTQRLLFLLITALAGAGPFPGGMGWAPFTPSGSGGSDARHPHSADTVTADSLPIAPADSLLPATRDTLAAPRNPIPPSHWFQPTASPLGDLAVRLRTRGEFGGDWTRFRPCDAAVQLACNPALLPVLQPEIQFALEVEGTVADRLFVDVDWDENREFTGANRFQIYYRGEAGALIQRLEVGDVSFALPESRFLTRGIPAGNFGLLARAQAGGVEFQTVAAQQQGARRSREFRLEGTGLQAGIVQEDTVHLDDADYLRGQFFFLVDPTLLAGHPHVDILDLRPGDAPLSVAPGPAPIQLFRMERDPVLRQQVEGYVRGDAVAEGPEGSVRESGWFRHLRPGVDYYLHPSGLWVALRAPLRPDEALAVTYQNALGVPVGDYNPEEVQAGGGVPTLRLIRATRPQHQPGRATWDMEMKQVYRISGSDEVDLDALDLSISLGQESGGRTFRGVPEGRRLSYLRLFGVDETTPLERVDRTALFQPFEEVGMATGVGVQGTFLVFPTLRPFLEPGPLPSEGLSAEDVRDLLGGDLNRRIYEAEDPFERETSALYRLNMTVRVRSTGVTSTLVLGSFGIREGSERIYLGDRLLRPFVDYILDGEIGIVTLLQPEALLDRGGGGVLRVTWEEAVLFRVAPTSLLGVSARVSVGERGAVDFVGLYQAEREIVNRPRFGAEPGAVGMLGVRGNLEFDLPVLDAFLRGFGRPDALPEGGVTLRVEGEVAGSLPRPNLSGDAFLDDFDAGDERGISLLSTNWHLGSRPEHLDGTHGILPAPLDETTVGSLVWQHSWVQEGPQGDSVGVFEGFFPQQDIDRQINVAGSQAREPGLLLTFGRDPVQGAGPVRWRSLTTLLSPSGTDLTQTEYLDFYVAEGEELTLILDLGLVSEDAFFVDSQGQTSGIRPETGRPWGLGVLDEEGDPLRGEIWSPALDALGVWPESCIAQQGRVYRAGERSANCTRGNGRRDTEDLNGNGVLDTTERTMRYVVRLDTSSPFLSRSRTATGTRFRLFRIPLRGPHAINPGGAFSEADWRAVQFLRVTVAGPRNQSLTMARMRLVGSRWVKRGVEGVLQGIGGDTLALGGRLEVTPVSILTEGPAYQAPPGVLEQLDDPAAAVSGRGVEFGERSLGLRYEGVGGGDRVEVYSRFLQRPQNFLRYGELRLWTVARRGDWGPEAPTDFFVKIGSDPENFYLYRTRLEPAGNPEGVTPEDWLPERIVAFDRWMALRREAEERLLQTPVRPGDPPVEVWSADSTYAVVLRDRSRAPNLAAVREISMGVWNRGTLPTTGEIWINELRLGGAVQTPGTARFATVELDGGELLQARMGYSGQGPDFQLMGESPTFQAENRVTFDGGAQIGVLFPERWEVDLPVTVAHSYSDQDPVLLSGTDVRVDGIPGLRNPGYRDTRVNLALRSDAFLSGADLRLGWQSGRSSTLTTVNRTRGVDASVGYAWHPAPRTIPLLPDFLDPIFRILLPPGLLRDLREAELRWTPTELSARSGVRHRDLSVERFDQILDFPFGTPSSIDTSMEGWFENRARLALRPLQGLAGTLDFVTVRDVVEPEEGVRDERIRRLVEEERLRLGGVDLGWETRRSVEGRVTFRPSLPPWIRADLGLQTRYRHDRNSGLARFEGDSATALLRNVGGERDLRGSITIEPDAVVRALFGPPPPPAGDVREGGGTQVARRLGRTFRPITLTVQDGVTARYLREDVDPGALFQLGLISHGGFRAQQGVQASTLVDRTSLQAGSGMTLPGSAFLNVNFQQVEVRSLDRRSDQESRTTAWPDLRAGITELPLPGWTGTRLRRVSLSSGVQRTRDEVSYGEGAIQRRTRDDLRVPAELALEWGGGIITRYRGLFVEGDGEDPTGLTERSQRDHALSVETRIAPRGGVAGRAEDPLRLSFLVQLSELSECRIVAGRTECVPFLDQTSRALSLAVDTRIGEVEVGGHAAVIDRQSFTGIRTGFTQLQVTIWARMTFTSGPVDRLDRRRDPF